jgi:hypothetical protein
MPGQTAFFLSPNFSVFLLRPTPLPMPVYPRHHIPILTHALLAPIAYRELRKHPPRGQIQRHTPEACLKVVGTL